MITLAEVDWNGIALVITAVGGVLTTIFTALGWNGANRKARAAEDQVVAVVDGVENAGNGGAAAVVRKALEDAGVELKGDEDLDRVAQSLSSHVKGEIKKTALAMNVQDLLDDVVKKRTTKRLDRDELRSRLAD